MKYKSRRRVNWIYLLVTHSLVAIMFFILGLRFGSGLTFQHLIEISRGVWNEPQLARLINTEAPLPQENVDFSLFWEVWNRLERDYYDLSKLDAQKMVYGAVAGMTQAIGDPYTVFLPPETKKRLDEDLQGEFGGVGIQLGYRDNQLAVIAPLKDHPAAKAGVRPGEYILGISDPLKDIKVDTIGMTAEEAVALIRGQRGTSVTLTLALPGEDPRNVELTRDTIEIPTLEVEYVETENGQAAHLMLNRFGDKTVEEWDIAIEKIINDPTVTGLILDMRGNPGGYLEAGIDIASDFIDGGIVVSQQGRTTTRVYRTTREDRLQKYPVVVLVNKGSASASEIVAGALRDRIGAKLIGEQTFGKGTVQDAQKIHESGLNVTIARWLLPSGDSIQDTGLPVDVEATDNPDTPEIDEVVEVARQQLYN